jgi:hypothetical protein
MERVLRGHMGTDTNRSAVGLSVDRWRVVRRIGGFAGLVLLSACSNNSGTTTSPDTGAGSGATTPTNTAGTPAASGGAGTTGSTAGKAAPIGSAGTTGGAGKVAMVAGSGGAGSGAAGTSATAGASGAIAAVGGAGGSAGSSAGAGGTGTGTGAVSLVDCMAGPDGASSACGTFTTLGAMSPGATIPPVKIQLGPYGAQMDVNMGKGFENAVNAADADTSQATCMTFAALFGQDQASTDQLLNVMSLDFKLYTVYRPANWVEGETYPIITWGNGTCAQPEGYGALLRYIASYGYVVVAANSRWVGDPSAPMLRALDYMFAANDDSTSPYYHRLDTTKVGATGHSQGGMATISASSDARVKTVIIFNGGDTPASKPFLTVSGERDITGDVNDSGLQAVVTGASQAAFLFYHMVPGSGTLDGHLTLMLQPDRVAEPATRWFQYMLKGDAASAPWFVGDSCMLCGMASQFDYGEKGLM